MNLALHGLLLQVIVSIVQFQHGFRLCSAGEPGYLDFDNLPETNFSCQGKVIGGYYADVEAGCQMFHVCTIGQKDEIMDIKFLCLNGTVFDQETRVCERVDEVDCSKSERFYNLNLELYGNNAVTLSLHESGIEDEDVPSELIEDHESQRTTSSRPSTTSSTTTSTPRSSVSSTTSASGSYQNPNGYPQHYQPQPRFPTVQTSQSKSLYDDKNGGYHHQYIYHTGDHRNNNVDTNIDGNNNDNENHHNNNNQATSYQLFSNQGVSSTTGAPQIHQIRYSSTPSSKIQIHNDNHPTVSPIFHATSSTIQTLLNSNANSPALINPIFHNHGIASTTERFTVHNNNPRETAEYQDDDEGDERAEEDRRPLEAIQPTAQGKVSKLTISPPQKETDHSEQQGKSSQLSSQQQQQRITTSFLPTPASEAGQALRSFYPTPRTSTKSSSSHVTHIHLPPPPAIPQLKPHQVTIHLPPPDIQRIVQNPSPLLPSQSRVIVTAKASVSDESGRPLNSTQLVTLPLPTIPASYDDYKEGDVSFDPFYRDVPKVRNDRRTRDKLWWSGAESREKRSQRTRRDIEQVEIEETKTIGSSKVTGEEPKKKIAKVEISEELDDDNGSQNLKTESKAMEMKNYLKTMSSKYRLYSSSEDKVDEKSVIDTKESDEEEYVDSDDAKLKATVIDTRKTDAEEYVNDEADKLYSKIFDEPESKTSKEVDVRAVAQDDSKYAKDRSNRLGKEDKNLKSENSNSLGTSKRHPEEKSSRFSLALREVIDSKSSGKHSAKKLQLKADISEKEEISQENLPEDDYYYDAEMDYSSLKSNEGDSEEFPNNIKPSPEHKSSRHSKSFKTEDVNEDEYYDLANESTTQSNEQVASYEMSGEYVDSSQVNASSEDSREVQDDEEEPSMTGDNITQEFIDDATSTTEKIGSSESTTSRNFNSHEKQLSEGVFKFTDEIPRSESTNKPEEAERSESEEEAPQDYIDDNYEPQSYKEQEVSSSTTETTTTEEIAEDVTSSRAAEEPKDGYESSTTGMSSLEVAKDIEDKQNDQAQPENNKTEADEALLRKSTVKQVEIEEASTTTSTTSTTTISTTSTLTTTPATTTTRPTLPKHLKPFTIRKSYVYVPPTTTPVPVVIKPRLPLLNPKPAKPLKSYNDLAPKPIIRKSPLFSRKALTTARTTMLHEIKNPEDSTKVPVEITTEVPKVEEIDLSLENPATEVPTTRPTESSSSAARTLPSTGEDGNPSINDNYVPISIMESVEVSSTTETQTFTPYPILRMTEATVAVEKDIVEAKEHLKVDISTTDRSYVESNDVPSASESGTSSRTPEATTVATPEQDSNSKPLFSFIAQPQQRESPLVETTSESSILQNNVATNRPESDIPRSTPIGLVPGLGTSEISEVINRMPTSIKAVNRRPGALKRTVFFNCLEKEMYRFHADVRDCRLIHYCSPGFTPGQVLDFRFVCEEGTAFDEETHSCIYDVKGPKCSERVW